MKILISISILLFAVMSNARNIKYESCEEENCQPLAEEKIAPLRVTLENLAENLGPLVNQIDGIIVTKNLGDSAVTVADINSVDGAIYGYDIFINEEVLNYSEDLSAFLTFKERKFLGDVVPKISAQIPSRKYSGLYYILLHELGHIAWYKYGVDPIECSTPAMSARPYTEGAAFLDKYLREDPKRTLADLTCNYTQNSFMSLSWENQWFVDAQKKMFYKRLPEFDVAALEKICFYDCDGPTAWTSDEVKNLYSELYDKTPYTSVYSAYLRPEEDFAESFALRALAYKAGNSYVIDVGERQFDLLAKTKTPGFAKKAKFVDELLAEIVKANK